MIDEESSLKARQRSVTPKQRTETAASTEKTQKAAKTGSGQRRRDRGKPLVPIWLQILIFVLIAAFLVLIWYNMETGQPASPLVTEG